MGRKIPKRVLKTYQILVHHLPNPRFPEAGEYHYMLLTKLSEGLSNLI